MAVVVAELVSGQVIDRGVDCRWARIALDDDYGDLELRLADPDDFLGWPTLLEIMPVDNAEQVEVVERITSLMQGLSFRGMRVLAQSDYAALLPGGGEVVPATRR